MLCFGPTCNYGVSKCVNSWGTTTTTTTATVVVAAAAAVATASVATTNLFRGSGL